MSFTLAKRTLVGSLITASSFSTLALAQQQAGFTITPSIGYYNMDDDRNTKDDEAYSLGLGYQFNNPWALEFVYVNADTSFSSSNTDVDVDQYRLDALYHLPTSNSTNLTPYLAAGIGKADFSNPSANNTQLNAGGGVKYALNDSLSLRADFRLLNDQEDHHLDHMTSVGLQMTFGHSAPKATPVAATEKTFMEQPTVEDTIQEPIEETTPEPEVFVEPTVEPEPVDETESALNEPAFAEGEEPSLSEQATVIEAQPAVTLNVQFGNNKTTVEQTLYPEIQKLATYLNENPNSTVVIEGHTDDSGAASYNQTVSEERAQAISDVLINTFQISEKRVSAIGYGEEKPLFSNDTDQHRKANRRVTAVISSNEA
ncbi:flagellar motor protein MotB [Marinomonas ushuaiensis DSM 15871]|uniref:Flagellar motor protein MotB n=1 Tax=Marinomonas ushuaiensis DSM 15871 TaxID=1122207 RepID=X7E8F0_9GAMM|nr:OmpA family protein [Marinomonas ushuaiensis]ETX12349.1 flagellar motor protein MotB [Marinomonas ushuaiensis DSM 15871]